MRPSSSVSAYTVALALLVAPGCIVDRTGLGGLPDSGTDAGARPPDAGTGDSGTGDSGTGDSGTGDSGLGDSGAPPDDAGRTDASPPDAGAPDSGPPPTLPVTTGLLVHFDATDVLGDGSTPSATPTSWSDLTGGNDGACTDVTYEPSGLSPGHPAIYTNGVAGSRCVFSIPDLHDLTFFVVFRTADTRSASNWYDAPTIVGGDADGEHDDGALYMSAGRIGFGRRATGLYAQSAASYADDAPHFISMTRIEASGDTSLRVDSGGPMTGTTVAGRINRPDEWYLASAETPSEGRFACHYAEVLVYTRVLSTSEVIDVQTYLQARWGF